MDLHSIYHYETKYKEYKITGDARIAIFSDLHIPFFDIFALELAIDWVREIYKPTHIILNGDTFDGYSISRHEKSENIPFETEVKATKEFFRQLRGDFPKAVILAGSGNHEDMRIKNNVNANSPHLSAYALEGVHAALGLSEYNIIRLPTDYLIRTAKTGIVHGDMFKGGGGANPAQSIMNLLNHKITPLSRHTGVKWWLNSGLDNLIFGHFHRISKAIRADRNGLMEFHSSGCFQDLRPSYMSSNLWRHGFITLDVKGKNEVITPYEADGEVINAS